MICHDRSAHTIAPCSNLRLRFTCSATPRVAAVSDEPPCEPRPVRVPGCPRIPPVPRVCTTSLSTSMMRVARQFIAREISRLSEPSGSPTRV